MTDDYREYRGIADLYDHVVPYRERTDVDFFVEAARDARGPVLEIGCGSGRVLIPCARAGVPVTGLDRSGDMLAVCRARLENEPPHVRSAVNLVQGDMRQFELGRSFALATIPFRPFQHLVTVEDQLSCLACIRRHLVDGGRLVVPFDSCYPVADIKALMGTIRAAVLEEQPFFRSSSLPSHGRYSRAGPEDWRRIPRKRTS